MGERELARVESADGTVLTAVRTALIRTDPADGGQPDGGQRRIPWHEIAEVTWDADTATLQVTEFAGPGVVGESAAWTLDPSGRETSRFLQVLNERVRNSVLLQRHVDVGPRQRVRIVGRRVLAPGLAEPETIVWQLGHDPGLDAGAPEVAAAVDEALRAAADDLGVEL